MVNQLINDLIAQYNIKEADIFRILLKKILLGEVKDVDAGYNLHLALGLDLNSAVELAVKIQFLADKEKADILSELNTEIKTKIDLETELKNLVFANNINIDDELFGRLQKLLSSYIHDLRDELELKDALLRSPKVGGIGLVESAADALISQLKIKKPQWHQLESDNRKNFKEIKETDIDVSAKVAGPKPIIPAMEDTRDITIDQILAQRAGAGEKKTNSTVKATNNDLPFVEEIAKEEEFLESREELPPGPKTVLTAAMSPAENKLPASTTFTIRQVQIKRPMIRQTNQTSQRPQVADVKFEPQLYGPIDELAAMSLADFRRLAKDPKQAAAKISGKLEILEGESILRKNDGIKALKSSPLYKIYADIMNKALVEGKSIEMIIAERGDINLAEFRSIMELNKSLKY